MNPDTAGHPTQSSAAQPAEPAELLCGGAGRSRSRSPRGPPIAAALSAAGAETEQDAAAASSDTLALVGAAAALEELDRTDQAYWCCSDDTEDWRVQQEYLVEQIETLRDMEELMPNEARAMHAKMLDRLEKRLATLIRNCSMTRHTLWSTKQHVDKAKKHLRDDDDGHTK